jgi:hypothetical protein
MIPLYLLTVLAKKILSAPYATGQGKIDIEEASKGETIQKRYKCIALR